MSENKNRVYLSGAITGTDDYQQRFAEASQKIRATYKNVEVINPALVCQSLPESYEHAEYMRVCLTLLCSCDTIYLMKGWRKSVGARIEAEVANRLGLDIIHEEKEV